MAAYTSVKNILFFIIGAVFEGKGRIPRKVMEGGGFELQQFLLLIFLRQGYILRMQELLLWGDSCG